MSLLLDHTEHVPISQERLVHAERLRRLSLEDHAFKTVIPAFDYPFGDFFNWDKSQRNRYIGAARIAVVSLGSLVMKQISPRRKFETLELQKEIIEREYDRVDVRIHSKLQAEDTGVDMGAEMDRDMAGYTLKLALLSGDPYFLHLALRMYEGVAMNSVDALTASLSQFDADFRRFTLLHDEGVYGSLVSSGLAAYTLAMNRKNSERATTIATRMYIAAAIACDDNPLVQRERNALKQDLRYALRLDHSNLLIPFKEIGRTFREIKNYGKVDWNADIPRNPDYRHLQISSTYWI